MIVFRKTGCPVNDDYLFPLDVHYCLYRVYFYVTTSNLTQNSRFLDTTVKWCCQNWAGLKPNKYTQFCSIAGFQQGVSECFGARSENAHINNARFYPSEVRLHEENPGEIPITLNSAPSQISTVYSKCFWAQAGMRILNLLRIIPR